MKAQWLSRAFGMGAAVVQMGCAVQHRHVQHDAVALKVNAKELTIASRVTIRDTSTTKAGEAVHVEVIVRNDGKVPVWLNGRLALGRPEPRELVEIWFEVQDEKMNRYEFVDCRVRRFPATRTDYTVVNPGKEVSVATSLKCFSLLQGHTYTLVSHYRDGTAAPPRAPSGSIYFSGELVSVPVTFTLP